MAGFLPLNPTSRATVRAQLRRVKSGYLSGLAGEKAVKRFKSIAPLLE